MPINAPNYQFPEDIPHVSGDRGTGALAVRNDTDAVRTDADGDYTYIATDATGAVKVVSGGADLAIRPLDCETDSVTICPPVTGVFDVNIVNEITIQPLDCSVDSVTICPPVTGVFDVSIVGTTNIRELDCSIDSVTICPPATGSFDVNVVGVLDTRELDCTIDSITICPPATGIFDVNVVGIVDTRELDCAVDSVTICPPATGIFDVNIVDVVDTRPLDCTIDSITICPPITGVFDVDVIGTVDTRELDCAIDSVTVCPPATGTFDVNIVNPSVITVVPGRRSLRGVYFAALGPLSYTTAADAATGGDVWIVNTSSSVVAYLKHLRFTVVLQDLALLPQLPTIRLERMTFTGTPSGTLITPAKRDSTDLANTATVRTTSTGMVITAGAAIDSYSPAAADVVGGLLAANAAAAVPSEQVLDLTLDDYIAIRQNEGLVIRQHTAGSATENRFYWVNFNWEEI